jgi:Na+/H+-dicarboxylate symporter
MIVIFFGKRIVTFLNKYAIKSKTVESVKMSELTSSEDVIKTLLFGLYFVALIAFSVIKYNHINIWKFSEESINPVISSFTTFLALDRIVTHVRKFKAK